MKVGELDGLLEKRAPCVLISPTCVAKPRDSMPVPRSTAHRTLMATKASSQRQRPTYLSGRLMCRPCPNFRNAKVGFEQSVPHRPMGAENAKLRRSCLPEENKCRPMRDETGETEHADLATRPIRLNLEFRNTRVLAMLLSLTSYPSLTTPGFYLSSSRLGLGSNQGLHPSYHNSIHQKCAVAIKSRGLVVCNGKSNFPDPRGRETKR